MLEPGALTSPPACRSSHACYWDFIGGRRVRAHGHRGRARPSACRSCWTDRSACTSSATCLLACFCPAASIRSALALSFGGRASRRARLPSRFRGSPDDEGAFARTIAEAVGADHTEIQLGESELLGCCPTPLASFDHPSGDAVNTYVVSKAVRSAGHQGRMCRASAATSCSAATRRSGACRTRARGRARGDARRPACAGRGRRDARPLPLARLPRRRPPPCSKPTAACRRHFPCCARCSRRHSAAGSWGGHAERKPRTDPYVDAARNRAGQCRDIAVRRHACPTPRPEPTCTTCCSVTPIR